MLSSTDEMIEWWRTGRGFSRKLLLLFHSCQKGRFENNYSTMVILAECVSNNILYNRSNQSVLMGPFFHIIYSGMIIHSVSVYRAARICQELFQVLEGKPWKEDKVPALMKLTFL